MDKRTFFDQLHSQLAKKHGLEEHDIVGLRGFALGRGYTRRQSAERCAHFLTLRRQQGGYPKTGRRRSSRAYYQKLLNFIASCSEETWKDITQKTKFDR